VRRRCGPIGTCGPEPAPGPVSTQNREDADLVRRTAAECCACLDGSLGGSAGARWSSAIPEMEWSVDQAVAHIAFALLWYAMDLSAGTSELSVLDTTVKPGAAPADLVRAVRSYSHVLTSVIEAAPPDARGWHPAGIADASGFAAMGCDEMLVHTYDAARGLGVQFDPTPELADRTLRRLFPWAPRDVEPWDGLKWANGRVELPGLDRLTSWRWHCAPLSEWDGKLGSPFTSD
jgi:uncharacterized protein (TIGR03083 family)